MNLEEKRALSEAFANEFKDAWKTIEGRHALAEKIVKYISYDVEQQDLSGLILDKDTFTLGQKPEYVLRSKLKAYWHEPGSYAPRSAMTQKVFTVPTAMVSVHPEYEVRQLKAGRYGTIMDQVDAAREEILGQFNALVWNTIRNAIGTSGSNYAHANTPLTQAQLDAAINWVEDQAGGVRAIVGRKSVVSAIAGFSNNKAGVYSDRMLDEIMRKGVLELYKGIPVIGLPQYIDGHGMATISPKSVLVVGNNLGKFVMEDDIQQMEDVDINDLMWHMHVWAQVGCAVLRAGNGYRIDVYTA